MARFLDKIAEWSKRGISLPYAYDPETQEPSVTLLVFYVMFVLTTASLVWLHFDVSKFIAASTTMIGWILSYVFYRLRKLDNFKINFMTKEITLDADDEDKPIKIITEPYSGLGTEVIKK